MKVNMKVDDNWCFVETTMYYGFRSFWFYNKKEDRDVFVHIAPKGCSNRIHYIKHIEGGTIKNKEQWFGNGKTLPKMWQWVG